MKAQPIADLYSDYLLASFGATTATGLSELLEGEVSHDQVTRYLAGTKKTATELWRTVKPFVREVQSEAGVLIIDDSIEEKPYTDENEIVCWHYRGRMAPSGARPSTGPEKRSAPRAGQRLAGVVARRWRPPARSLRGRDRRG